jgi:hypothetical protein
MRQLQDERIEETSDYKYWETRKNIQAIRDNEVYKQVLKDSFGGVCYNVANRGKYDATEILRLWDEMSPAVHESIGGIMTGAINFLLEVES